MNWAINHHRMCSRRDMSGLMDELCPDWLTQDDFNALGALDWHISGCIRGQEVPPLSQLRSFNMLVSFLRHVEEVVTILFAIFPPAVTQKSSVDGD